LRKYTKLCTFNDIVLSFHSENNHENIKEQEDTTHVLLEAPIIQHTAGNTMSNWDQIQKRKQDIINKPNEKENMSQIPYEYKVGDQVFYLKHPGFSGNCQNLVQDHIL
jgi:hypothetical protein